MQHRLEEAGPTQCHAKSRWSRRSRRGAGLQNWVRSSTKARRRFSRSHDGPARQLHGAAAILGVSVLM